MALSTIDPGSSHERPFLTAHLTAHLEARIVHPLGTTPCVGGSSPGVDGEGYCRDGHRGALCAACADPSEFYDAKTTRW